jgi:hypothetical protein
MPRSRAVRTVSPSTGTRLMRPATAPKREARLQAIVQAHLDSLPSLSTRLARGEVRVF